MKKEILGGIKCRQRWEEGRHEGGDWRREDEKVEIRGHEERDLRRDEMPTEMGGGRHEGGEWRRKDEKEERGGHEERELRRDEMVAEMD